MGSGSRRLMEWLLEFLQNLSPAYVYTALGGILLLCGLGLPIPEDITLLTGGYLAYKGLVNVHWVFAVCFTMVLLGDTLAFGAGWFFGHRLINSEFGRKHFTPKKQLRVRAYFRKFGSKVVFIARFLPGLRFSVFLSAGTLRVRPATFVIYDGLAALLSVPALVYLAWHFGDRFDAVLQWARHTEHGILAVVAVVVGIFVYRMVRDKRAAKTEAPAPVDPNGPPLGPA